MIEEMTNPKEMRNVQNMSLAKHKKSLSDKRNEEIVAPRDQTDIVKIKIDEQLNKNSIFIDHLF